MHIILTHENADFDAIAALLAAYRLDPAAVPLLPETQNRNVASFLTLYQNGLPFARRADVDLTRVQRITLVDTQRLPQVKGLPENIPVLVVDHHPVKTRPEANFTLAGEVVGATTTLLVEQIQAQAIALTPLEATLLALGIYEDTGALTYGQTSSRDARAVGWLLEQQAALDTIRRFLAPPLDDDQQALFETLLATAETRAVEGHTIVVAGAKTDKYIAEIAGVAHRLRETLDPAGLFVLVEMPTALHLVCRSTEDAVNVGEIARKLGGGGHERAAAASLHGLTFEEAMQRLWETVEKLVQPAARIADLMSYGVQTVDAGKRLNDVVRQMRRIGHEGFPVVEDGRIVGLLTRRDADRAAEHGLGNLAVREIMTLGEVTLRPTDSVAKLEELVVETGWGQIPVVDENNRVIGIVTRTDLIKHWARAHPALTPLPEDTLTIAQIEAVLGHPVARLVDAIARHAQGKEINLYMVGGVVRDLLLKRPNFDVDFVVEDNAIHLARGLQGMYGGRVSSFRPFGTAKWQLDTAVARALGLDADALPAHVDFATARNEFYEHPTALPTVYSGSIKLDLQRRDFTINTLAVQFSPASAAGRILDFYGGLDDLRAGRIRALHSLSFVDDPTRMLRAARFEHRLGFKIEPRTAELMQTALPMLRRVTGERIRNELNLLLREDEPERGWLALQARGLLTAIHPGFGLDDSLARSFQTARVAPLPWQPADLTELYWHLIALALPAEQVAAVCERLLMPRALATSMQAAVSLMQDAEWLAQPDLRPSQIVARLSEAPETALLTVWLATGSDAIRNRIERFVHDWRHVRPATNGHILRAMGLTPGPCFAVILTRLRAARLDGEVTSDAEEARLVQTMIEQGACDDSP